ncbi:putative 2-aminoethylphosphonate ABC transporter substrate-binding protein [Paenibacillus spongiae]|uniref:2-aminoethylphosphonate ABC transporter substrate-binding protein n=1 Tax=Paenibacillus spongiae TaxID=2909671 RepID=A0ABY5S8L9_9BACL|nr:putative 2-aminoethylphosphonate ABC transporter substrate-binding protein [Paenibacillus spongiae]UVI30029.1 putative 2-aminoethylphosphonate ABC transporter substrate-binding protein [Paenibacillus spongiae]
MKKRWLLIMSAFIVLSILSACGSKNNAPETNGGGNNAAAAAGSAEAGVDTESKELTVYTALEDDQINEYLKTWKSKYPDVKLNIVRDSTGIITAKLLAEKDNPQADVVWGTAATSLLVLDQNGMIAPYSPKGIERIEPSFKDSANPAHWVGIDAWETAFTVNTVELEKKGIAIPQSYEDLIKPEYKGLITMPNPASSGTGFLTVSGLVQLKGAEQAWAYLDKLHENIGLYTHSGSKPAKMAGTGEYPIGISFGYRSISEKKKGSPVETVFPAEGSGWDVEANALVNKPAIKQVAKDFLDWAISDEAMQEYNKNFAIVSVKSDSSVIPEGYSKNPVEQLIKYDLQQAAKDREAILGEWTKRYDGKSEPKS